MTTVAWYSDFDGVFNISKNNPTVVTADVATEGSEFLSKYSDVTWDPEILDLFRAVVVAGKYDFSWLTTWNDAGSILRAAEAMGLHELYEYAPANLNRDARSKKEWTQWKAEFIIADQRNNPRPFIWIDDDAPTYWEDYVRGNTLAPSKIIKTSSRRGLARKDLANIIDWTLVQRNWRKP